MEALVHKIANTMSVMNFLHALPRPPEMKKHKYQSVPDGSLQLHTACSRPNHYLPCPYFEPLAMCQLVVDGCRPIKKPVACASFVSLSGTNVVKGGLW